MRTWSRRRGSNSWPRSYRDRALPTELRRRGGEEGTRTLNPRLAKPVLYQLSYFPSGRRGADRPSEVTQPLPTGPPVDSRTTQWKRRESNPGPAVPPLRLLRAYPLDRRGTVLIPRFEASVRDRPAAGLSQCTLSRYSAISLAGSATELSALGGEGCGGGGHFDRPLHLAGEGDHVGRAIWFSSSRFTSRTRAARRAPVSSVHHCRDHVVPMYYATTTSTTEGGRASTKFNPLGADS